MSEEKPFVDGLIIKAPRENAPDFVKGSISLKREDLIQWLQGRNEEWINVDIMVSKSGKWYGKLNDWKPEEKGFVPPSPPQQQNTSNDVNVEDIPF